MHNGCSGAHAGPLKATRAEMRRETPEEGGKEGGTEEREKKKQEFLLSNTLTSPTKHSHTEYTFPHGQLASGTLHSGTICEWFPGTVTVWPSEVAVCCCLVLLHMERISCHAEMQKPFHSCARPSELKT